MKTAKKVGAGILVILIMTLIGCQTPMTPTGAGIVTSVSYPHYQAVVDGKIGAKTGKSSSLTVLGLVSVGNASVVNAARDAGITEIKTIDHYFQNVLFFYYFYQTIVTGD